MAAERLCGYPYVASTQDQVFASQDRGMWDGRFSRERHTHTHTRMHGLAMHAWTRGVWREEMFQYPSGPDTFTSVLQIMAELVAARPQTASG